MFVRAELVLFIVAFSLAVLAIAFVLPRRVLPWRAAFATACCVVAALAPLLLFTVLDAERARGSAFWEWSAVGGPTIQASYRLDGLAAAGVGIGALFVAAALVATTRVPARHQLLRPTILLNGFVFITLAVTDDLIAAIVALGSLAALTSFVAMLVSTPPAVARLTAYLAAGVQSFVVSALLLSRFGGASFRFDAIAPDAATPGVILAASIGGALFAGLYPFVPWGYRHEEAGERESLRGLLTMPAGLGATILLLRSIGVTRIDLSTLALPGSVSPVLAAILSIAIALVVLMTRRRGGARRRFGIAIVLILLLFGYEYVRWSHVVLVAALLTIAYAAAVSFAFPEQWAITRYDVALATMWIALASGSSTAVAGAFVAIAGAAFDAISESFWMPPHRSYITVAIGSTAILAGVITVAIGAFDASDIVTIALAATAAIAILGLQVADAGRRLSVAAVPSDLDVSAAIAAFLGTVAIVLVLALPLADASLHAFGRAIPRTAGELVILVPLVSVLGTLLVVVARAIRPFLPELASVAKRLDLAVSIADPVPAAAASFRVLAGAATAVSSVFSLFEERAGVWLALLLIATLLVWAVR